MGFPNIKLLSKFNRKLVNDALESKLTIQYFTKAKEIADHNYQSNKSDGYVICKQWNPKKGEVQFNSIQFIMLNPDQKRHK